MAVKIRFDSTHNAEQPTLVLATKNGRLIGKLPANNIQFKDCMNAQSELRFSVNKVDCFAEGAENKKAHIIAINVYGIISTPSGYTRIGQIEKNKVIELTQYYRVKEKISKSNLKFSHNELKMNFSNLKFISEDDYSTLYVSDEEGNILIKVDSDGYVYLNNATNLGLETEQAYLVELSFDVPVSMIENRFWEQIKDFKLVWVREWNIWFEMYVETNESDSISKAIQAYSLGEVELSQINLYNIEINTETDIERDDYKPTVLFDEANPSISLLHKITEKAPHYIFRHIDFSIAKIQRTFTFNNTTIYDAFQEISQEINCLFEINCYSNAEGKIIREINVYDLESYCLNCSTRGNYTNVCTECGSKNIQHGYGNDTSIFISTDNLADNITFDTDEGSVKNCFRLEAGDDLMTATLINCNPNGSGYIWYISDETKEDMSFDLVAKLNEYDKLYNYYQKEYETVINEELLGKYNDLIDKYSKFTSDYSKITSPIVGYPDLMKEYYNTIDFYLYLNDSLMPSVETSRTTAGLEGAKLNNMNLSPVAVQNIDTCTVSTATSAVLAMAKTIIKSTYQVKVKDSILDEHMWAGVFTITNHSDEEDTYTTPLVYVAITGDYEKFVKQKIDKVLSKQTDDVTDIVGLFDLEEDAFKTELKRYSLSRLTSFHDCCQSCIDILIEQGIADRETWANQNPDMYRELYVPYYNKLSFIQDEISVREGEISVIMGTYDKDGDLSEHGLQTYLENERDRIQDILNFEKHLGEKLWLEFVAYRREDTYSNTNYISDGLNNAELFQNALEFIEVAKKEIYKSATMQHSISASLKNLLVMKEFEAILDYFEVGNWLRIRIDDNIYILRLIEYGVNFDSLESISVVFSDVKKFNNDYGVNGEDVLNQVKSMASSYGSVSRQANKGKKSNERLDAWVNKGLALTKMKIIDNADNQNITWDSHGLLCTEYLPITDTYDDKQLKIINKGLYLTDDNWLTSRAGIGNFSFYNPETGLMEESYGVIADTLVGNLVLSEKVGVYNTKNSIVLGENGAIITADNTASGNNQMTFTIQRKELDVNGNEYITPLMYIDNYGNLVLNGSIRINSTSDDSISSLDELADIGRFTKEIQDNIYEQLHGEDGVYSTLDAKIQEQMKYTEKMLSDYKAEVGQYLNYDENGLTLGASTSAFKTVIDNQRLAFYDGNNVVAYISNNQLYIPNAVIQNMFSLGKYAFVPRETGGLSLMWQGD